MKILKQIDFDGNQMLVNFEAAIDSLNATRKPLRSIQVVQNSISPSILGIDFLVPTGNKLDGYEEELFIKSYIQLDKQDLIKLTNALVSYVYGKKD